MGINKNMGFEWETAYENCGENHHCLTWGSGQLGFDDCNHGILRFMKKPFALLVGCIPLDSHSHKFLIIVACVC